MILSLQRYAQRYRYDANKLQIEKAVYTSSLFQLGEERLSSLRFALHHAKAFDKSRIIYVIPYLSIIDQTAKSIRDIFAANGDENLILEHHSDINEPENEEEGRNTKLATSRWENPIIITTLVQFLETVMSSKSGKLRKFHNMQDSIIIFDEIQSLPVHSIHLFNEVITFLSKILNCTILLCTATQPLLDKTERKNLLLSTSANLIGDVTPLFINRRRTNIIVESEKDVYSFADFIAKKAEENNNCLVIVNTKKMARELYGMLISTINSSSLFHLSTSMCSVHRLDTLNNIKISLTSGKKAICISTQLIEAGVDISFDCVIRAMAGLDSIIQAAGRCNRNGEAQEPKNVYVVPIKGENLDKLIDIKQGKNILDRIIRENPRLDLLSNKALEAYYRYYFFERNKIMDFPTEKGSIYSMLSSNSAGKENYKNRTGKSYQYVLGQAFATASEYYQTIGSNTKSVIVIYKQSKELIERFKQSRDIKEKLSLLRKLNRYTIQVFQGCELDRLIANNSVTIIDDEFGIKLLDDRLYSTEIGLVSEAEYENIVI